MKCRVGCGACCIGPSISPVKPALPEGKKAGERCPHLNERNLCLLFETAERPAVCGGFKAEPLFCGSSSEEALSIFNYLEESE